MENTLSSEENRMRHILYELLNPCCKDYSDLGPHIAQLIFENINLGEKILINAIKRCMQNHYECVEIMSFVYNDSIYLENFTGQNQEMFLDDVDYSPGAIIYNQEDKLYILLLIKE